MFKTKKRLEDNKTIKSFADLFRVHGHENWRNKLEEKEEVENTIYVLELLLYNMWLQTILLQNWRNTEKKEAEK